MPATLDSGRIGREIARLRKQLNISTTELARRAGLSQPQISRLENGKQGFRSETLLRISRSLGVSPAHFFVGQADAVLADRVEHEEARVKRGRNLRDQIERQYGQVAVTPAYKQVLRGLAQTLGRPETDDRVLRQLLKRIFDMSNGDREYLLASLSSGRQPLPEPDRSTA